MKLIKSFRVAFRVAKKTLIQSLPVLALILIEPGTAYADLTSDYNSADALINQGVNWFVGLAVAAAVFFIARAGMKMQSAEEDGEYMKGKRNLNRSILGLIVVIIGGSIVEYIKSKFS
ncbi:hypothetical protein [Alicyclobacillus fastidiosus]|uniref:hypothetical protein n=1 Tax=Alicyclobacillus fastidiosus TaxID=392011 RepID=UPI0023E98D74|nr:hypothetical protein [Alicyclobacillus fastidiosus]GMA65973.1 hypothetical protein GCM10025859_64150 [Alicyclobacillus fastidiosus]GMA66193.1 hypothetical protein GCM10025859_66350 [Alicyclobacillus fastidiosus]